MMRDRGYVVSNTDLQMDLTKFREEFGDHPDRNNLTITTHLLADEEQQASAGAMRAPCGGREGPCRKNPSLPS